MRTRFPRSAALGLATFGFAYIHPSCHASPADLRAFAAAICPKVTVPVHGVKWDEESHGFGTIRPLAHAEPMVIP